MKKTPVVGRFLQQLNQVNDQICFSSFQQWEFATLLRPFLTSSSDKFSTSVFPKNPYAENIHRRVSELADFASAAEATTLQAGVVASVEHLIAYMIEVQAFREGLISEEKEEIKKDAEEEQLRLKVANWAVSPPPSEYFRTIGYFRHLRNHYAHVNLQPTPSFASYVRSYGSPLNTFWNNGETEAYGLDFQSLPNDELTPELTFGIVNLLRICLRQIDSTISATVDARHAISWTIEQIKSNPKNHNITSKRLQSKAIRRLETDWGSPISASEVDLVLSSSADT